MPDHTYHSPEEEKEREKLKKRLIDSALRGRARMSSVNDLGKSAMRHLPAHLNMVQNFMNAGNWRKAQQDIIQTLNNTVVIVGQPNTGKSTLFNKLKGQMLSPASSQAGTTKTLVRTDFGPFTLVDTPGHLPDVMESGMSQASVIIFMIDASRGLQAQDRELYKIIKALRKSTIVVVNKVDTLKGGEGGDQFATEVAVLLGAVGVIPISALTGKNLVEELIPAIIEASPEAALAIGRELPAYRREAAQRIIRNSALIGLAAGVEPIPLVDIPILLGIQIRLVLRIAALYGEPLDSADAMKHARELIATIAGGLGLRYLAQQAAKLVPFGGDFIAGTIAGAATWSIGQVALEYYASDRKLNPGHIRQLYQAFQLRFQKEDKAKELMEGGKLALPSGERKRLEEPEQEILEEGTA